MTLDTYKNPKNCCLCGEKLGNPYGFNAEPIKNGRCCAVCNYQAVLPTRLKLFVNEIKKEGKHDGEHK